LVDRKKLVRNVFLNLFGYGIPLIVAVFTIPIIIKGLGTDRFGILTLAWVLIGYLGLFDMGLGRALTKLVAEKLGSNSTRDIPSLIWTALLVMLGIGIIVALFASMILPLMARDLLKVPVNLKDETYTAFLVLLLFTPVVITSVGFRGILDAYQRFDLTNAVRIPLGLFTFIAPLIVIPFSVSLVPLFLVLMAGRLVAMLVQMFFCLRIVPDLKHQIAIRRSMVGTLLKFGGWMTITNIISPLMMYADRLFIGAVISVTAVAYYATPGEVITKLLLISGSLMGVLFPAFSSTFKKDRLKTIALFSKGIKYIYLIMLPIILVILTLAGEGLTFWLGAEFARQSTRILQLMAVAVFFISLGQVPYSLIQGVGRPDITAKLHLVEFPVYLIFLWFMIQGCGIQGAALAWMIRAMIDSALLYLLARRQLDPPALESSWHRIVMVVGAFLVLIAAAVIDMRLSVKLFFLGGFLLVHAATAWTFFLNPGEKEMISSLFLSMGSRDA
jgi:O-antigen/teichoic acid export membrane protein